MGEEGASPSVFLPFSQTPSWVQSIQMTSELLLHRSLKTPQSLLLDCSDNHLSHTDESLRQKYREMRPTVNPSMDFYRNCFSNSKRKNRNKRMNPPKWVKKVIKSLRTECQRIHLLWHEQHSFFLQKRREHFNDILRGERSKQAVETELVGIGKTGKRWDANRAKLLEDWELHNKKQELTHE